MFSITIIDGNRFEIRTPYNADFVAALKNSIHWHYRKWDAEKKVWVVLGSDRVDLVKALILQYYGAGTQVIDARTRETNWDDLYSSAYGYQQSKPPPSTPPPPRSVTTWADTLRDAMPAEMHEKVYKALMRVLHPDMGGSTQLTQQLNDAFRRGA